MFFGLIFRVGGSENFIINFYLYVLFNYDGGFGILVKGKFEDVKFFFENK